MMRPHGRYSSYSSPDQIRRDQNADRRRDRLAAARAKGTHTPAEWTALVDTLQECVICGVPRAYLHGHKFTKDHIVPLYQDGCDCIANIQPTCRNCNSSKGTGAGDYRFAVRPDWCWQFLLRFAYGWDE